jgi:hypothetical protein
LQSQIGLIEVEVGQRNVVQGIRLGPRQVRALCDLRGLLIIRQRLAIMLVAHVVVQGAQGRQHVRLRVCIFALAGQRQGAIEDLERLRIAPQAPVGGSQDAQRAGFGTRRHLRERSGPGDALEIGKRHVVVALFRVHAGQVAERDVGLLRVAVLQQLEAVLVAFRGQAILAFSKIRIGGVK